MLTNERIKMDIHITSMGEVVKRKVTLMGLADIMFDRYPGDNQTKLEPWQKMYISPSGPKVIGLPALNIMSALSAHNTNSFPKRLRDKRKFKDIANALQAFTIITPTFIPLVRNGSPIVFGKLNNNEVDEQSGCYIHHAVARLDKGIPNPKSRPVIPLPWSLEFELTILPNREIKEQEIINLIEEGGRSVGLGTWRGTFGKFRIEKWE